MVLVASVAEPDMREARRAQRRLLLCRVLELEAYLSRVRQDHGVGAVAAASHRLARAHRRLREAS